ncbi:hypothetical protein NQ314_011176 [Rhamnusium bicolor]|uniref:Codanin-1 C-terminal domain-containing protein n=1 Tax=Rhamnusium bicolor TaxID=1586634 RepID=A0AAV8XMR4_9CUCU|nr:hypothetical protein NQ314_011176 [Rhamnusium bicolor]
MGDILLNKIINEEIEVGLFIKWLLKTNTQEQYFDEFNEYKCSQTEFLTYFLNFIHEEIPCQNRYGDRDTPQKIKISRRTEPVQNAESSIKKTLTLCANIDKTDMLKSASYPTLNKTLEKSEVSLDNISVNGSHNSSTPKIFKVQSEYNLTNGYVSPISPLYRNQNSSTPIIKRQILSQKSAEKVAPLCLGDFIVNKKSSGKKKASRVQLNNAPIDESSKRIKPTCLNQVKVSNGFRKTDNSFDNFQNTEEMPVESLNESRHFLAEERLKILSRKNSGDNLVVAASKHFTSLMTFKVEVEPDVNSVSNKTQLDYVIEVYLCILRNKLVLNITSEIYFLISLLLNKQHSSKESRENSTTSSDDFHVGVDFLNEEDKGKLQNIIYNSKRKVFSCDLFETIHNVVYFAARCLESQMDVLKYYDKSTLKLLSQNTRLRLFANSFAEKLGKVSAKKTERVLELIENDAQMNICFNLDTDNRENFPNDFSFHAFRKQRDLFYEILRIWEVSHMLSGWNFAVSLGGKIKSLFSLQNEPANFMHFSRLFKAQLLTTCRKSQKEEGLTENQMPFLSSLANVDADKLNRLRNRLVTKQSANGINSLPSFTGHQEFYKDFIIEAANYVFNKHLCDTLIAEIVELNDTKFSCTDLGEAHGVVDASTRKAYLACLKSLRVLAKFLGFVESLPYKSDSLNYSGNLLTSHLNVRQQTAPCFNMEQLLVDSLKQNNAILTVPWVTDYLSMLDYVTLRLSYNISIYKILFDLYKNYETSFETSNYNYNISLVRFCLGWLFELPHFPDSEYFNFCTSTNSVDFKQIGRQKGQKTKTKCKEIKSKALDELNIVDQNILYICCPYLEEIKRLLSSNALNTNVTVKHITPVTAVQSSNEITKKRIEQQLEEAFFSGQPISVKKTVEFVSERIASSCVKHICNTIVPSFKKTALEHLKSFLEIWKVEQNAMSPSKDRSNKAPLKTKVSQMAQSSLRSLRESCEKEVYSVAKEKIPTSIDSLLAIDVLPQTKGVCIAIATKMCVERVRQWISSHVTLSVFTKDFDGEMQKALGQESKRVVKEKPIFALPSGGSAKKHNDDSISAFHLMQKIQDLAIEIVENSKNISKETFYTQAQYNGSHRGTKKIRSSVEVLLREDKGLI